MFYSECKVNPQDHPILVTEPPLNPKVNREMLIKLLFETFRATAVLLLAQAPLCLLAAEGRSTGLVVDIGHGIARTVYGDHGRYLDTYLKPYGGKYFTGDGCKRDKDGCDWPRPEPLTPNP